MPKDTFKNYDQRESQVKLGVVTYYECYYRCTSYQPTTVLYILFNKNLTRVSHKNICTVEVIPHMGKIFEWDNSLSYFCN